MKALVGAVLVAMVGMVILPGCSGEQAISPDRPDRATVATRGTLRAAQIGDTVVVEIALSGLPERERMLGMGLKLTDGTVIYPKAIHVLKAPSRELATAAKMDFDFSGSTALGEGGSSLYLQVVYELENGRPVGNGSTFSLVLGDPDSESGREMGITTGVSTRDGSPFMADYCITLNDATDAAGYPTPPAPRRSNAPAVRYRFEETLAAGKTR